jgi:hypothetical protein
MRETHTKHSGFKKIPLKTVIGFCHISLYGHKPIFPFSMFKIVKYVKGYECVVSDESTRYKGTLVFRYDIRKLGFDSICYSFGEDFESDIAQGYRSEVFWTCGGLNLGYKAYIGVVITTRVTSIIENVQTHGSDICTNSRPVMLVELGWKPIRARCCKTFQAFHSRKDFLRSKRLIEKTFHVISELIVDIIDSRIHINRILTSEQLLEMV